MALHACSERVSVGLSWVNLNASTAACGGFLGVKMSTTEHNKSQETGKHESSEGTDRPEGTVAEGANAPLTDPTKTDVDRDPQLIPPQGTEPAVPPYEGRQQSSAEAGTPGRGENEQQSPG
jgi:hypothetical protein